MGVSLFPVLATTQRYLYCALGTYTQDHDAASATTDAAAGFEAYQDTGSIYRCFASFDTNTTSITGAIQSARLLMYCGTYTQTNSGQANIHLIQGVQEDPVARDDYGDELLYVQSGGVITATTLSGSNYGQALNINATGLTWINSAAQTKFCFRCEGDISNSTPSGLNTIAVYEYPTPSYLEFLYGTTGPVVCWFACETTGATNVTGNSATLTAITSGSTSNKIPITLEVTHDGESPAYPRYRFAYGPLGYIYTTDWQTGVPLMDTIAANITGLQTGTSYIWRLEYQHSSSDVTAHTDSGTSFSTLSTPDQTPTIEMAFNQPIYTSTAAATWTDITDDVMSINTKRGRMHELDRVESGTAVITVDNSDGDYWRYNTSGAFYTSTSEAVKPLTLTRINFSYGSTTYPIYYGYTESLQPSWVGDKGDKNPVMTLQCVDFFKSFTRYYLSASSTGATLFASELSGARIDHVLDEIGFPTTMRNVTTGVVTVQALVPPVGGTNAMEHLYKVAEAEQGIIFISPSGSVNFHGRDTRQLSPYSSSSATFDAVS